MSRPDVRDERVPQIIDAAVQVFSHHGIDGANMSQIADVAGISKATIYHYFASKDEVIVALVKRVFSLDRIAVDQLQNGLGTLRDRLVAYAANLGSLATSHRDLFLVTGEIQARAARVPALKSLAAGFYGDYRAVLESVVKRGIETKEVDPDVDIRSVVLGYIAVIEGSMIVGNHLDVDVRDAMVSSVAMYVDGFMAR